MSAESTALKPLGRAMQVLAWEDVLVVVDDGRSQASDYDELVKLVQEKRVKYPAGFGVLLVVPRDSTPPPDDVRKVINETLFTVRYDLRCLSWLIEGSGFQAATVRAVLTGVRLFSTAPYPMHVATNMEEALAWMLGYLPGGPTRLRSIGDAVSHIQHARVATDSRHPESGITRKI